MSNNNIKEYILSTEVIQKVLNYLGSRPAAESMELILSIQTTAKPVLPPKVQEEDNAEDNVAAVQSV